MFSTTFFFLAAAVSSVIGAPGTTATYPTISTFDFNGSGCPPGSSVAALSSDASTVKVSFSQFTPSATGSYATSRQNCQAVLKVAVPAGQQFTLDKVAYSGFVQLQSSVAVTHESTYYFQAQLDQNTASASNKGPVAQTLDLSNSFGNATPIWSACGTDSIININVAVVVNSTSSTATGFASVDNAAIGPFVFRSC